MFDFGVEVDAEFGFDGSYYIDAPYDGVLVSDVDFPTERNDEVPEPDHYIKNLKATDITAMALAMDNNMTMVCFGLDEENSIVRVVRGEAIGTTVKNEF